MCELVARDAFVDALGDASLRVRVLEKEPNTLDAALALFVGWKRTALLTVRLKTWMMRVDDVVFDWSTLRLLIIVSNNWRTRLSINVKKYKT